LEEARLEDGRILCPKLSTKLNLKELEGKHELMNSVD